MFGRISNSPWLLDPPLKSSKNSTNKLINVRSYLYFKYVLMIKMNTTKGVVLVIVEFVENCFVKKVFCKVPQN